MDLFQKKELLKPIKMKKIYILTTTFVFSLIAFGQDKINFEYQVGYFFDQQIDGSVNEWSGDMVSPSGYDDNEMASRLSVNYFMCDKINLDFIYTNGSSNGRNNIEQYVTDFTELGVIVNYEVYSKSNFDIFANVGVSRMDFYSERTLVSGSEIPHSIVEDNSDVLSYGAKVKYTPNSKMYFTFSYSMFSVKNDGFDGWDDGKESDELIYRGVGIGFNIK